MTKFEIASTIISIIAFVGTGFNIWYTHSQIKISQGMAENEIFQLVSAARKIFQEISLSIMQQEKDAEKKDEIKKGLLNNAIEELLNAYENGCAKYLDNKVDKDRFKKIYMVEIRNVVEKESFKDKFNPNTSRYKAILKVYNEWNNLEK